MAQSRVTVIKQLPDELFSELKTVCAERRKDADWNMSQRLVGAMIQQSSLEVSQHLQDWIVDQTSNLWYDIKERITVAGNLYWNVDEVEEQWW